MRILISFLFCITLVQAGEIFSVNPKVDLGSQPVNLDYEFSWTIENRGKSPLTIGKLRPCCGAKATIDKSVLAPGESTKAHFKLTFPRRPGEMKKDLYIASDDKKNPYLHLQLKADLVRNYELEEEVIALTPRLGEKVSESVKIKWVGSPRPKQPKVTISPDFLTAELLDEGEDSWLVNINSEAIDKKGYQYGTLKIDSVGADPVRIPIRLSTETDLKLIPQKLFFSEKSKFPMKRKMAIRSKSGDAFSVVLPENLPKGVKAALRQSQDGKWVIDFEFTEQPEVEELIFKTTHPEAEEVRIEIFLSA